MFISSSTKEDAEVWVVENPQRLKEGDFDNDLEGEEELFTPKLLV
jgi:hypothetical protein